MPGKLEIRHRGMRGALAAAMNLTRLFFLALTSATFACGASTSAPSAADRDALAAGDASTATSSGLAAGEVLAYSVTHFEGSSSLLVKEDGTATRTAEATVSATVTPAELEGLAKVLRDHDLCGLRSTRETGVPDEARPSIAVRLEGLDCRVQLWDGEWRDGGRAEACLEAVEALGTEIGKRTN